MAKKLHLSPSVAFLVFFASTALAETGDELGLIEESFNYCAPIVVDGVNAAFEGDLFILTVDETPEIGTRYKLRFSDLKKVENVGGIKLICKEPGCIVVNRIWRSEIVDFGSDALNKKQIDEITEYEKPFKRTRIDWAFCDWETNEELIRLITSVISR